MDVFSSLLSGFFIAFSPLNLLLIVLGCIVGLFIGAMPGLGSVNGVAILLPVTFLVPPTSAIIFLGALYYGAMYGGAISSIMLGIPGASTAVATTFDGRPLALQGKADRALVGAAVASFVGGTISVVLFTLFAPPLASMALAFGSPEEFALVLLAFATFVGLGTDDIPKTIFSICIGLVLSAVGLDVVSGEPRLIFFDLPGFYHGINFLVLAIGIYGIGEILWTIETSKGDMAVSQATVSIQRLKETFAALKRTVVNMFMGSFLGYFVGILPAAGGHARLAHGLWCCQVDVQRTRHFRQRKFIRCRSARIGQQCRQHRLDAAHAHPRHPGVPDHRHPARWHGDLGSRTRSVIVCGKRDVCLGANR